MDWLPIVTLIVIFLLEEVIPPLSGGSNDTSTLGQGTDGCLAEKMGQQQLNSARIFSLGDVFCRMMVLDFGCGKIRVQI